METKTRKRDHGPAKVCIECKMAKEPLDYSKSSNRTSQLYPVCRACRSVLRQAEYAGLSEDAKQASRLKSAERYEANRPARMALMRARYAADPQTHGERNRDRYLHRLYGITSDEYATMLSEQDERCAACGELETDFDLRANRIRRLAVDHDHDTGAVRALLCRKCNTTLGLVAESRDRLLALVAYLDRFDLGD